MEIERLIQRYEQGVTFHCGCREHRLHPAVSGALQRGQLPVASLLRCPVHGDRMVEEHALGDEIIP